MKPRPWTAPIARKQRRRRRSTDLDYPCFCVKCGELKMTTEARHPCLAAHPLVLLWGDDALRAEAGRARLEAMRKVAQAA